MNRRSLIVAWLRVLLPLAALVVLSMLFLLSRKPDTGPSLPYAKVDAESLAGQPRITAPTYAGVTPDGSRLMLTADSATPAGKAGGTASGLRLAWQGAEGLRADLAAPQAELDGGMIRLDGGVEIATSTGWRLDAPRVDAATDRSRIMAKGGVVASAPFGRITADLATLERVPDDAAPAHHLLNFTGAVRLLYQP